MKYLKEYSEARLVINKSEFIACLFPINSQNEINDHLLSIKNKYPKATHYVTAWIFGENAQYASSNDDGEPSRTAGFPALDVLMKNGLTNVFIVIVRYFGGVKLGAGGLIRAYGSSASEVLKVSKFYKLFEAKKYLLKFDYHLINQVEHLLGNSVNYLNKDYLERVSYELIFMENDLTLLDSIIHQIEVTDLGVSIEHVEI